jgi:hypothetical protein
MADRGYCVPCNRKGHSCETENMLDGAFVCVFCEDGVDCPFTQRMKREKRIDDTYQPETKTPPQKQERAPMNLKTGTVRVCSVDDCGKALKLSNTSGRCTKHWYQKKSGARKTVSKATRKPASKPTALRETERSQEAPESAHIALTRDQLVALFTSWPIARQAAAVQAVFIQELS